jgi:orotidine-5'-phosphate decarboxylase
LLESTGSGKKLFEEIIYKTQQWATPDNLMYVIGATRADKLLSIRALARENFFLVPGVGAQGGDLGEVSRHGFNKQCGLLVNSSRSILYASQGEDFAEKAREEAKKIQSEMKMLLDKYL